MAAETSAFYEDTGTTAKLFWDASDETISIGTGASSTATISAFSRTVSASLPSALRIIENTGASTYWDIGSDGGASPNLKFYVNANTTPKVTFTSSGNVDIAGTVTADSLTVDGDATITSASTNSTGFTIGNTAASGVNWTLYSSGGGPTVAGSFGIYNNSTSTNALILSASNNLGLGMAPTTNNISKSISLVNGGSIFGYGSGTYITANSNYNGAWNTVATGPDSRILLDGNVVFSRSASATAGSAGAVSESMRIDTSGNVGIGATSITQPSAGATTLKIKGTDNNKAGSIYLESANASVLAYIYPDSTNGLSINTSTSHPIIFRTVGTERMRITSSGALELTGDSGAGATFLNFTADSNATKAQISGSKSGASGGNLIFSTNNTSAALTEAMRIDSSGNLLVGTTTNLIWNTTNLTGCVIGGNSSSGGFSSIQVSRVSDLCLLLNRLTSDGQIQAFARQGTQVGEITVTTSSTSYNTSSDYRLKENIADADDAGSKIDAIKVRKFDWKADGSHQDYGMVAQELMTVAPEAVSVPEDPEKMMGVDYSKLVPMMLKEIQSLRARVAQLEGAN
jgi:hypothetical protein